MICLLNHDLILKTHCCCHVTTLQMNSYYLRPGLDRPDMRNSYWLLVPYSFLGYTVYTYDQIGTWLFKLSLRCTALLNWWQATQWVVIEGGTYRPRVKCQTLSTLQYAVSKLNKSLSPKLGHVPTPRP